MYRARFRVLRLMNFRHVRQNKLRSLIVVASIAAGVSLTVAPTVVLSGMKRSVNGYARSFSGPAPFTVIGPTARGGLAASTLARVDATPGVRAAVPLVQAVTRADMTDGSEVPIVALGFDCRIESVVGKVGCRQQQLDGATIDAPPLVSRTLAKRLAVVRSDLGPRPVRGAIPLEALDRVNGGNVVAYPLRVAQQLFARPGALDAIYVFPERGVDAQQFRARLAKAVGAQNTVLARGEAPPWLAIFETFAALFGSLGLLSLGTGAVLAYNAIGLSLADRRRSIALSSALGASPRLITAGALAEATSLGIIGGLVGAALGVAVAFPLIAQIGRTYTLRVASLALTAHVTATPFLQGAVLGAAVGVVASIGAVRRAVRLDVVSEIGNRAGVIEPGPTSRLRRAALYTLLGTAALGSTYVASNGGGLSRWQPLLGEVGLFAAIVFYLLAVAGFAPMLLRLATTLTKQLKPPAHLGWTSAAREGLRTRGMVVAIGAAVGMALALASFSHMLEQSFGGDLSSQSYRTVEVTTLPINNTTSVDAKPSPDTIRAIRHIPGVDSVTRVIGAVGGTASEQICATAGTPEGFPFRVLQGTASARRLNAGEVLVGPTVARQTGVRAGGLLRLAGRDGVRSVRVQGVWTDGNCNGAGITMAPWLLEEIWGPQPPVFLFVHPARGVSAEALARRIEAAKLQPHLIAYAPKALKANLHDELAMQLQPFWLVQRVLVLLVFVSVLFSLLLIGVYRRRELGLVGAVGMGPRDIAVMVITEAVAVGVVGAIGGVGFGIGVLDAFRHAFFFFLPINTHFQVDPIAPFVYTAVAIGVAVVAAALPAWRSSRLAVVEAIRYE